MKLLSFSLILLFTSFTIADKFGKCVWPNGKKALSDWIQCPGQTNCCRSGETCLGNNLCYTAHLNIAYRGACADKDWPSSSCPHYCFDQVASTWANIVPCPNNTVNQFTCGAPGKWVTQMCEANTETFAWDTNQDYKVTYAALPQPNANTTTASTSTNATPTPSSSNSLDSQSAGACTPTADEASSHEKTALAAGLGAGLGVPLLLLSVGFLMFWMRTRSQLQEARATSQAYANALNSGQGGIGGAPYGAGVYGPVAELSHKSVLVGELDGSDMQARDEQAREMQG